MGCVFGREPRSGGASIKKSQALSLPLNYVNGDSRVLKNNAEEENKSESLNEQQIKVVERRKGSPNPRLSNLPKNLQGELVIAGWPAWLAEVAGEAIRGWIPRRADTFQKLDKVISFESWLHLKIAVVFSSKTD